MTAPTVTPTDLVDPELHATGDPEAIWRWMREQAPLYRHPPTALPAFWSLTRYDDVRTVYRNPKIFSSASGVLLRPAEVGNDPAGGMTLALTDPPRHKQLRNIVAQWFTAPAVRSLDRDMHNAVRNTLMKVAELGECDFLHDVSGRLSMYVIGYMMGIPEQDHEAIFRWTNEAFEAHVSLAQHPELMTYFIDLMDQRIAEPADDLVSALVGGTIDDEPLTEEEVLLNCENLVGATENGRLSIAGGMQAFLEYPDQWQRLQEDPGLLSGAIEEILRWTSSAAHSMRSVTTPHVMHGQQLEAGDWVAVWIPSANRDESVFHEPDRFDIGRTPNRHLALGNGEHVCLGSALARSQMRILFSELLARYHIEPNGPARKVRSIAVRGPEALPIRISPR